MNYIILYGRIEVGCVVAVPARAALGNAAGGRAGGGGGGGERGGPAADGLGGWRIIRCAVLLFYRLMSRCIGAKPVKFLV